MKKIVLAISLILTCFVHLNAQLLIPTYNDIWIPMRDGDSLQADVYIPNGVDSAEVILVQTPYNKNAFQLSLPLGIYLNVDSQPYIWVIVDWRGFYGSSGAAISQPNYGEDAYDICDWIVSQSWHKDKIGTWGPSALGGVQYQLCVEDHPNHTCAVPLVATGSQSYDSYFYGGVLEEARLNQLDALGYGISTTIMALVYDNIVWDIAENNTWFPDDIQIPTLQIGGWYDHTIDQMIDFYSSSRNVADLSVIDEQWLLVGPWVHGGAGPAHVGTANQGELTYPSAEFKSDSMAWEFFAYYLLDTPNGWNNTDYITYFDMGGTDDWLTSNDDDIHATGTNVLYLGQNNTLNSFTGIDSSSFVSDPNNPSPTLGGATLSDLLDQGPYDQSSLDSRSDIVTFSTATLTNDITITGRIQLDLYISSDQPDCDISIRLADTYPDGRVMLITDGIKRMRFRNNAYTVNDEVFMTPGVVYNVQVDLPFTRYTWKAGHQIKIYLGGNNAIRFNVNLQDGDTMYLPGPGNIANITVHHNTNYPSQIILPGTNPTIGIVSHDRVHFNFFPNPANEILTLHSDHQIESYQFIDLTGKVLSNVLPLINNPIKVGYLEPGMYILKVITHEGNFATKKFTKL